jgi:hypothetical protein
MSEQLEPCLMCGSEDIVFDGVSVSFYCHECGHYGPINFGNKMEAAALWNRSSKRAYAPQEEIAALRASRDALKGALLEMLAAHPHANDGLDGYQVLVTADQVNACRDARCALADHAKGEAS